MSPIDLMKFLSGVAGSNGRHIYVVGGAVRNHVLGVPLKDVDVVVDSIALGFDSTKFALDVQRALSNRSSLATNQYGVSILTVHGDSHEVIEIATARKESYGGPNGKGYKPHMVLPATIQEDILRREFTFNTLMWRLSDLANGPDGAEILDLTRRGMKDLVDKVVRTPRSAHITFADDPTRMLRAVKFVSRYGFSIPDNVANAIRNNIFGLRRIPWDAVRKIFTDDILLGPNPRASIALMKNLDLLPVLCDMVNQEPGMSSAVGRSTFDMDPHVYMDLLDNGFRVRTPISFLTREDQIMLRVHLLAHPDDPAWGRRFIEALTHPDLNQQRFFETFAMPVKERGEVIRIARHILVGEPYLMDEPSRLLSEVEKELHKRYPTSVQAVM